VNLGIEGIDTVTLKVLFCRRPSPAHNRRVIEHDDTRAAFLEGMARAGSCVTLVTTDGPAGRHGVTVSAMTSVSGDPPTLLVCINKASRVCSAVERNGVFCVNLLRQDQTHVSDVFAGRVPELSERRFDCVEWTVAESGSPVLEGAVATFDCRVNAIQDAYSHHIFVGLVMGTRAADGDPLFYCHRRYRRLVEVEAGMR
jgi:flavin reductase